MCGVFSVFESHGFRTSLDSRRLAHAYVRGLADGIGGRDLDPEVSSDRCLILSSKPSHQTPNGDYTNESFSINDGERAHPTQLVWPPRPAIRCATKGCARRGSVKLTWRWYRSA